MTMGSDCTNKPRSDHRTVGNNIVHISQMTNQDFCHVESQRAAWPMSRSALRDVTSRGRGKVVSPFSVVAAAAIAGFAPLMQHGLSAIARRNKSRNGEKQNKENTRCPMPERKPQFLAGVVWNWSVESPVGDGSK